MNSKIVNLYGVEYKITDKGEVYSVKKGNLISQRHDSCGYSSFTAGLTHCRKRVRTHLLVARLFVPNPNNLPEVDHLDGNRSNPSADNLEWVTHLENVRRSVRNGTHYNGFIGTGNPKAKLNEDKVRYIRKLYSEDKLTQQEISKKLNIPWSTIHNIVTYQTWKNI